MLKVLTPGLCSLLVDRGRWHSRGLGVPVGGPADRWSFLVGNALVGNPPETPALEISLAGPTLQACCQLACVVHGAPFDVHTDRQPIAPGKTFTLLPGEMLHIGGAYSGMRAYLCVRGGFEASEVLGSRGGLRPLQAGDVLHCRPGAIGRRFVRDGFATTDAPVRVVAGGQAEWFHEDEFYGPSFRVMPDSNRMGLRLGGKPLRFMPREMVSEPVCPGTVQVTRVGGCIILGVDGQTIGGYPRIAHVISADLDRLGQLRPGDTLQFQRVSLEDAEGLYHKQQADRQRRLNCLRHAEILFPEGQKTGNSRH